MPTDQYGTRLPEGAVARLGIVRPGREGERFSAVRFAPDGQSLATGGEDCAVRLWDLASCRELRRFGEHPKTVSALAFSPDGKVLASGSQDGTVALWDVATGRERTYFPPAAPGMFALAFSADGGALTALCGDEHYHSWDLEAHTELGSMPSHLGTLYALAFAPDGAAVVTGSWENFVRLCDIETGQEIRQFQGHRSYVQAVAMSPDGRTIASGSPDETIRLWEVLTGKERLQFPGDREGIFALAFSPDGRLLASAGNDTTVHIWDLTGRASQKGPRATMVPLMPSQLEPLWLELANPDPVKGYRAVWAVATQARQMVPFIKNRMKQLVPADQQRIQVLLGELSHDMVTRRDRAVADLEKLGWLCEMQIQAARAKATSMDLRRRLDKLAEKVGGPFPSPDSLHALRLVETLELAGTAEARQILHTLSLEKPPTRITAEAKEALRRLGPAIVKRPVNEQT
jgi:WD40 repeat protein